MIKAANFSPSLEFLYSLVVAPNREPPQDISAIQTIKSNAVMEIHHCINLIAPLPIIPNYCRA
jgi:hypothetical protein